MRQLIQRYRNKLKMVSVGLILLIVIFGFNYWGTRNGDHVNSIRDTGGIPKTHSVQVGHPTRSQLRVEHHRSRMQRRGHLKDVPGDDSNPKKG